MFERESVDMDGHLVLIHETEQQRRTGLASWVRLGLDRGAKVLYNEAPEEAPERSLVSVLEQHGVDPGHVLGSGQLQVLAANEQAYCPTWQEGVVDEALADGYPSVWWAGEASTAWGVMSPVAHTDVEWETDDLCLARPVSILCQYPAHLPQATLQTVIAMHGAGVLESQLRTSPARGGVRLAGSVDASNERILRSALVAATATNAQQNGTFSVDLSRLEFLDVAGARALLTGTTTYRIAGGTVRLTAAQSAVAPVLELLGVDVENGFEVVAQS